MINSKKFFFFALSLIFYNFLAVATSPNNSSILKKLKKPKVKRQIVNWIAPIFLIDENDNHYYLCSGALIHPRVVLSADKPFESNASLYSVGTFQWNNNSAQVNNNDLKRVIRVEKNPVSNYSTFELDPRRLNINRTALLILLDSLTNVNPININNSLSLSQIYDHNTLKVCRHLSMIENHTNDEFYWIPLPKTYLRILTNEIIIQTPGILDQVYDLPLTYVSEEKKHYVINNDSQVFFTLGDPFLKIDALLGSPILCRIVDQTKNLVLAGILTETIDNLLQYTIIKNNPWIHETLAKVLTTL